RGWWRWREPSGLRDGIRHTACTIRCRFAARVRSSRRSAPDPLRGRRRMFFRRAQVAPRSQELVFPAADDDLGTIPSKLESSSAEEIYLVIPRRSSVLRTPLEFRILARIANEMSSETVLVTDDPSRRRLANQEGFRTRRGLRTDRKSTRLNSSHV